MKQQFNQLSKISLGLILLMAVLFSLGCNNNESEDQTATDNIDNPTIENESIKAKPPEMDIHTAVVSNNIEAVKHHVLAGTDLNTKDPFGGSSPLISAALFGKTDIVKILIEGGADINFINNDGSNALHVAAFFCRPEIVQILLDNGIDKTAVNKMESTAYQSVAGEFKDVKPFYDMIGQSLAPYGLILEDEYLQKTRPIIAEMLK